MKTALPPLYRLLLSSILILSLCSLSAQNKRDWKAIATPMQSIDGLLFWHRDSGFAMDATTNTLYKTTDGANTWQVVRQFRDRFGNLINGPGYSLFQIIDRYTIYVVNWNMHDSLGLKGGTIWYRTTDGGLTWHDTVQEKFNNGNMIGDMLFFDKDTGLISRYLSCNQSCPITLTIDGARSFSNAGMFLNNTKTLKTKIFKMGQYYVGMDNKNWSAQNKFFRVEIFNGYDSLLAGRSQNYTKDMNNLDSSIPNSYLPNEDENWWNRMFEEYTKDGCNTWQAHTANWKDDYTLGKKPRYPYFVNEQIVYGGSGIKYYLIDLRKDVYDPNEQTFPLYTHCMSVADSLVGYIGTKSNIILKTTNRGGLDSMRKAVISGMAAQPASKALKVKVYPNPASNEVTVECKTTITSNEQGYTLTLTDASGRTIKSGSFTGNSVTLSTAEYPRGIYILRLLSADGGISTHKLVLR